MTTLAAAQKDGVTAIATDSCLNIGDYRASSAEQVNTSKLIVGDRFALGLTGTAASHYAYEVLVEELGPIPTETPQAVFGWMNRAHGQLKERFFAQDPEADDDFERSPYHAGLLVGPGKIYLIAATRNVAEFRRFRATGSGDHLAIGAMEALYDSLPAEDLVRRAVEIACKYDSGSEGPVQVATFDASA